MSNYSPTTITSSGGKTRDATDEERGEGNDDAELAPVLHATMSGALGHSKAKGAGQLKNQSSAAGEVDLPQPKKWVSIQKRTLFRKM